MQRLEVDAVPVLWQQGPAPLSGTLVFRVGLRDESFVAKGVTHLVEHLVMGALPKSHLDRNASVGPGTTEFTATGRPEAVADFLTSVCGLLVDLPVERLATEARVLAVEQESQGGSPFGELLVQRYGATGLGLLGLRDPAVGAITAEQVREHARRWFVSGNAVLVLTGPPPDGLALRLPDGPRGARAPQRRPALRLPAQTRYGGEDVAVSFELPSPPSDVADVRMVVLRVLQARLEDRLRHRGGHSYDVDFLVGRVDNTSAHAAVFADAGRKQVAEVAEGMWEELHRLAQDGPTSEELAHDLAGHREALEDPRGVEHELLDAAKALLSDASYDEPAVRLAAQQRLTSADVASALRAGLGTLLVLVPDDAPAVLPALPELLPAGSEVEGTPSRRRLWSSAPRGALLVHGPAGASLRLPGVPSRTVRYDDCVGVGLLDEGHACLQLVGADGTVLSLCERDWKDGSAALAEAVTALVAVPHFHVEQDERELTSR